MNAENSQTHHSFCRICESLCGLEIDTQDENVVAIRPDFDHVATRGFACPKGLKQHKMYDSPDRLLYPLKRVGNTWERVSWDQALEGIGEKIKSIIKRYSKDSIAMYVGTAAGFGVLHPIFAQGFMDGIGSKNMFASASQDCSNKFAVAERMYGFPFTQPFPDLQHTNCLIIAGANPVISKWSFLQVPNPSKHLKEMQRRGCKIYIVDPRRTETAKIAGEHIYIRPNTDAFFYLSLLDQIIKLEVTDNTRVKKYMKGLHAVVELAQQWPAERTTEVTGIDPSIIRRMAADYINATGACMYSSTGVNMGSHGSISFWIQECINAISGNLDTKGGTLVGKGIIDFPQFAKKKGILLRKDKSRIANFHSTNDTFPGGILADEILTPGNKQIRALFVTGGNPLLTMANSNRLRKAFKDLELLVTLDIYPNETGSVGHYMLPCTSPFQRPDLPFIFPLMLGLQTKPYLQATKAVIPSKGEQRDEASIYLDICKAAGISIFGSWMAQKFLESARWFNFTSNREGVGKSLPQEWLLSMILRLCRKGSFKNIVKRKSGTLLTPHQAGSFLGKRVYTEDGKVDLAPQSLLAEATDLEDHFIREKQNLHKFKLISRRAVTTHNSWTHNIEEFVRPQENTNYLYMHSEDAMSLGIQNKNLVEVSTSVGSVRVPVKLLEDLMRGTVALPHGWGHQSSLMNIANKTTGVNVNILVKDGPDNIEKVSGMVHLSGFFVDIRKVDGKLANSWSGKKEDVLDVGNIGYNNCL